LIDRNNRQGKIKYIGLSEVSARTLRRAVKVEHVDAVQLEYSPFSLECEQDEDERYGVKKACEELGIALVAYSPLGESLFTDQVDLITESLFTPLLQVEV
jgi:aryl-alcohol dehydrogenase-like predicted oxidoreductase